MSPFAPMRPCPVPGCLNLVRAGRCEQHGGAYPAHRWDATAKPARIRGSKLQALRTALFHREPLCRVCAAVGRTALATIRDHIVNLAEGGTEDERNVQPLCAPCHQEKIEQESARGQRRHR